MSSGSGRQGFQFLFHIRGGLGIGGEFQVLRVGLAGFGVAVEFGVGVAEVQVGDGTLRINLLPLSVRSAIWLSILPDAGEYKTVEGPALVELATTNGNWPFATSRTLKTCPQMDI